MFTFIAGTVAGVALSVGYNYFFPKKFDKISEKYMPQIVQKLRELGKGPQEINVITSKFSEKDNA